MPSITLPNVIGQYSSTLSLHVVGGQYTPTLYNILGAIPSAAGPSGFGGLGQQPPLTWGK